MEPVLLTAGLWLLFGGFHLGAVREPLRGRAVARWGERGFVYRFSALSALLFALLVAGYASVRGTGAGGPGLGAFPALRGLGITGIVAGMALMAGGLADYAGSPMSALAGGVREPRGLDRVTRHPFFAGLAIFSLAHALMARELAGAVFFAGFALVSSVGARHQDRKLLARRPEYAGFLATTSAVPFAAIAAGRQRWVPGELPWRGLAVGVALAGLLHWLHPHLLDHGGVYLIVPTLAGVGGLMLEERRRERAAAGVPDAAAETTRGDEPWTA